MLNKIPKFKSISTVSRFCMEEDRKGRGKEKFLLSLNIIVKHWKWICTNIWLYLNKYVAYYMPWANILMNQVTPLVYQRDRGSIIELSIIPINRKAVMYMILPVCLPVTNIYSWKFYMNYTWRSYMDRKMVQISRFPGRWSLLMIQSNTQSKRNGLFEIILYIKIHNQSYTRKPNFLYGLLWTAKCFQRLSFKRMTKKVYQVFSVV